MRVLSWRSEPVAVWPPHAARAASYATPLAVDFVQFRAALFAARSVYANRQCSLRVQRALFQILRVCAEISINMKLVEMHDKKRTQEIVVAFDLRFFGICE